MYSLISGNSEENQRLRSRPTEVWTPPGPLHLTCRWWGRSQKPKISYESKAGKHSRLLNLDRITAACAQTSVFYNQIRILGQDAGNADKLSPLCQEPKTTRPKYDNGELLGRGKIDFTRVHGLKVYIFRKN